MKLGAAQFVRAGSFLAGLALAAIAVAGWRVPTPNASGAHLQLAALGTSELRTSPAHRPFLVTSTLKPGSHGRVNGQVSLHNTMEQPLAIRIHAVPDVADLDHTLRVKASVAGKTLYAGTLGGLRSWSKQRFVIPMHQSRQMRMQLSLPRSLHQGYQNYEAKISIEFKLAAAERLG
jgi:hypothetical protein